MNHDSKDTKSNLNDEKIILSENNPSIEEKKINLSINEPTPEKEPLNLSEEKTVLTKDELNHTDKDTSLLDKLKDFHLFSCLNPNHLMHGHHSLKKTLTASLLVASFVCSIICINMISKSNRAKASIVKRSTVATSQNALNKIIYEGQEMYVAKATFYDYYSDSQISTSATPGAITDALDNNKNTFSKFNQKMMELKKYNVASECPAKYPMYQGRPGAKSDMTGISYPLNEETYKASNYWTAANSSQIAGVATQGLVDNKLKTTSSGETYLTQSNPDNKKSTNVPFFDKDFLTKNKFDNSSLTLGKVYENISFPFRRVDKDGITYYEFYSNKDTVRINNNRLEYLGYDKKETQVKDAEGNYGFFPYNTASEGKSKSLNFGHGVKIEVPFIITKDGKINGKDMVYTFSGDDDVWVFIDGILALDIGGNHGEVSGTINFATGESTVSKVKNNKVGFAKRTLSSFNADKNTFADLGISGEVGVYTNHKTKFSDELLKKLKDTKQTHTLTFFYMERGLNVANMKMSFNLIEPTVLNVTNTIKTDNVGKTFTEETKKVASKDSFLYDVSDRTVNRTEEIDLMNNEAVTFSNEFDKKDSILVQQKALKLSTRKLTSLYSTSWNLKDTSVEISKGTNLLVTDTRSNVEKTFLFANKTGDDTPVLTANYVNVPKIGDFELECNINDDYKKKYKDYQKHSFTYTIKYSNTFGGDSKTTAYVGEYILKTSDNKETTLKTTNGKLNLKPGEKAIIKSIPVETMLYVAVSLNDKISISKVHATENFTAKIKDNLCSGKVLSPSNIIKYTMGTKDSKGTTTTIPVADDKKKNDPTEELEEIAEQDMFDKSPSTSDESVINIWVILGILSLITGVGSFIYLFKDEFHNYYYKK